ncbi:MAG: hypothetical protein JXQ93_05435 [Flavobacteriaceae bacterium]
MKLKLIHIVLWVLAFTSLEMYAQKDSIRGYRIDGDYIVFRFNKNDYINATNDHTKTKIDFSDLNINEVFVSGRFNDWSKDQWKMKKISNDIYELKKKLTDLNDFKLEFKFVVNQSYWAEPTDDFMNITPAKTSNGKELYTYNLKVLLAYPSKDGNYTFRLPNYIDANEVILSGSFNKWNEEVFKMNKTKDGWELKLKLKPSYYEYKFIVDGKWIEDPNNTNKVTNEFGGFNSFIDIKTEVTFLLTKFKDAKKIMLASSFNDWNEEACPMKKTDKGWLYTIKLSVGKYHYKYIVDGKWVLDPDNSVKEYDFDGNINSVKMVK